MSSATIAASGKTPVQPAGTKTTLRKTEGDAEIAGLNIARLGISGPVWQVKVCMTFKDIC